MTEDASQLFVSGADVAQLGTDPIPVEYYKSPADFVLEQERIFRRMWIFMGRVEDVPRPGDYFVRAAEDTILGTSILVVRGKDAVVRAFHNVCSHRQAKLVHERSGNKPNFQCKYHGWGYGLNGDLRSVPDTDSFFDLDMKKCRLASIYCETWNGFIFINLADKPEQDLKAFLSPIIPRLEEHDYAGCPTSIMLSLEIDVNWKVWMDNFQDPYHLAVVHSRSFGDTAMSAKNPYSHPLYFHFPGPHRIMGIWGNLEHQASLVEGIAMRYGAVISAGKPTDATTQSIKRHPNWQVDIQVVFPNLQINPGPGFYFTHEFFPLSPTRTRWYGRVFFPKAKTAAERFSQEYAIAAFRDTVAEDMTILTTQQDAIQSGAKKELHFQISESMCRHAHNTVQRYIHGDRGRAQAAE